MRVVRKTDCCGEIVKQVSDIPKGTVFSGYLSRGPELILLKGAKTTLILLEDCRETVSGAIWRVETEIHNYKELNVILCIEE